MSLARYPMIDPGVSPHGLSIRVRSAAPRGNAMVFSGSDRPCGKFPTNPPSEFHGFEEPVRFGFVFPKFAVALKVLSHLGEG